MDITVIYSTGRKARSCSYGIAQLLIGSLLAGGTLHEFQLPRDFSHFCVGCYACIEGREDRCGGHEALAAEPLISSPVGRSVAPCERLLARTRVQ